MAAPKPMSPAQVKELADVLKEASAEFPQLAEHATFLDG